MRSLILVLVVQFFGQSYLYANPGKQYERSLYAPPARVALSLESMTLRQREKFLSTIWSQTKNDYVGNHAEMDTLARSLDLWLTNWEYATRSPTVVGVWGLTGSGKTSVVRQVLTQAGLDPRTIYIDLKRVVNPDHAAQAISQLITMFSPRMTQEREKWSNEPRKMVVILDEFQRAQTRAADGSRLSNPFVDFLMECLGNQGQVSVENSDYSSLFRSIESDLRALEILEADGLPNIRDYPSNLPQTGSKAKAFVRRRIRTNQELLSVTPPNVILDFSQALFVTLGNFPIGFRDAESINPELASADELHRSTSKMTRTDLTELLKKIFHPEDLGRLGPDQLIFHSILEKDYYALIDLTLSKISDHAKTLGLEIEVSPTLKELLVSKVLMPGLGPRVFLEVLYKTFDDPLLRIKRHTASLYSGKKVPRSTKFLVSASEDGTIIRWSPQNTAAPINFEQPSLWGELSAGVWRSEKTDGTTGPSPYAGAIAKAREKRLIVAAVHEAAHATLMASTQKIVPDVVQTDSQSQNVGGFTRFAPELKLEPTFRSDAIALLAYLLAGVAGEVIVFGEPSLGGTDDFKKANLLAASLFRTGNLQAGEKRLMANDVAFQLYGPVPLGFEIYRESVDSVLQEGLRMAKEILQNEKRFFLELSQKLSEQPSVQAIELLDLVKAHWADAIVREQILSFNGAEGSCAESLRKQLKKVRRKKA
jgi:hypothetical protein